MRTSEYVSIGHPDKIADFISEYILDRILEQDSNARYALEVQIKDNHVTLGGEITTKADISAEKWVKEAVEEIGYTKKYSEKWGKENTICSDDLEVRSLISAQSLDIAQGVDIDGWGDQGIFFGYAENNPDTNYMPLDYFLAKDLNNMLYSKAKKGIGGLDIKTQITLDDEDMVDEIIVAIPVKDGRELAKIRDIVDKWAGKQNITPTTVTVINGTGKYIKHSSMGDCGTTGRKLAVDFYGGNSPIGGGCPWTKDGTKADLALNVIARFLALNELKVSTHPYKHICETKIRCCIGKSDIIYSYAIKDKYGQILEKNTERAYASPREVIEQFELRNPKFASICKNGLFGVTDTKHIWEL